MNKSSTSRTLRYIRLIAINIIILSLSLVVIEGLASYVLLTHDFMKMYSLAERRHTKYDPDLGWVNESSVYIPNMYGPGIYLKTNSRGFRNNREFDPIVPNGKHRIISQAIHLPLAMASTMTILGVSYSQHSTQGLKR